MENIRQDPMSIINNLTYDPNWTFDDPFSNTNNQPPTTTSTSSENPFESFLHKDEYGQIVEEHLELVAQDPEASQFVEKMALYDKDRYLAILLSQGAKLPQGFDINTLPISTNTNVNNPQNMSHSSQPKNTMNNFFDATTTIQATSNIRNTSNTINATSNGGSESTTMPTTSMILSQSARTTFGSLAMWEKYSNPLFTMTINAIGTSLGHNTPLTATSTTMGMPFTYPLIDISQNPLGGGKRCIFIQGQQQNVNKNTQSHVIAS